MSLLSSARLYVRISLPPNSRNRPNLRLRRTFVQSALSRVSWLHTWYGLQDLRRVAAVTWLLADMMPLTCRSKPQFTLARFYL
ncbi:hypothetical protein CALVIDRAFT_536257 [Calocera viscosa TUFC12733]|uniref:Uncharacterized protein n=1 Tax=Calocera viscosa (strain TUFC12733) TaxID=1330018 RepID=A0A167N0T6_CALVF|nr:hypothetical protein CALVIDRAFT_536257 [Calocera viscosa TUFC12733]